MKNKRYNQEGEEVEKPNEFDDILSEHELWKEYQQAKTIKQWIELAEERGKKLEIATSHFQSANKVIIQIQDYLNPDKIIKPELIVDTLKAKDKEVNKLVLKIGEWSALAIDRAQDLAERDKEIEDLNDIIKNNIDSMDNADKEIKELKSDIGILKSLKDDVFMTKEIRLRGAEIKKLKKELERLKEGMRELKIYDKGMLLSQAIEELLKQ